MLPKNPFVRGVWIFSGTQYSHMKIAVCTVMKYYMFVYSLYLEQIMVYNTGLIPSQFYEVLGDKDKLGFNHLLISSSLLILGTALVSWRNANFTFLISYSIMSYINGTLCCQK